jgi:hypothetical protein
LPSDCWKKILTGFSPEGGSNIKSANVRSKRPTSASLIGFFKLDVIGLEEWAHDTQASYVPMRQRLEYLLPKWLLVIVKEPMSSFGGGRSPGQNLTQGDCRVPERCCRASSRLQFIQERPADITQDAVEQRARSAFRGDFEGGAEFEISLKAASGQVCASDERQGAIFGDEQRELG